MMKRAVIRGLLAFAALFFSASAFGLIDENGKEYILPQQEERRWWEFDTQEVPATGKKFSSHSEAWNYYKATINTKHPGIDGFYAGDPISIQEEFVGGPLNHRFIYKFHFFRRQYNSYMSPGQLAIYENKSIDFMCMDKAFPNGVDKNGDRKIDRCYGSECRFDDKAFTPAGPLPLSMHGTYCAIKPGGAQKCIYKRGVTDSGQFMRPMGESCNCNMTPGQPDSCVIIPDPQNPDQDPNKPDCYKLGGTEICKADPEKKCSSHNVGGSKPALVCEAGCGFTGSSSASFFVCVKEVNESDPCRSALNGENRPGCHNVPDGQCPAGFPNCKNRDQQTECETGDVRPECTNRQPGQCPVGSPECTKPPIQRCQAGDTRPDCIGKQPGQCPAGMICPPPGTQTPGPGEGTGEDGEGRDYSDVLNEIKNSLFGDFPSLDNGQIPVDAAIQKRAEAHGELDAKATEVQTGVGEQTSQAQNAFQNKLTSMLPSGSGSCSSLSVTIPGAGRNATFSNCSSAPLVRLILMWVFSLLTLHYVWRVFVNFNQSI